MNEKKYHRVGHSSEFIEGQGRKIEIEERVIAVFRVGTELFAVDDTCPHRDAPLSEGVVEDLCVVCPYHYSKFDLRTGDVRSAPATQGIAVYGVRLSEAGDVEIAF